MRVLAVEDEPRLAALIVEALRQDGHTAESASTGPEAISAASIGEYDVIVLDVMLPGSDGFSVCQTLRGHGVTAGVLMLTARDSVVDRVQGLDAGADDYLGKPFAFAELLARVRALGRRAVRPLAELLHARDVVLDPTRHQVTRAGDPVELTNREYALLEYFLRNPERVLTRMQIIEHVWGTATGVSDGLVDLYVHYLRTKFGPGIVDTVRGAGYRLRAT